VRMPSDAVRAKVLLINREGGGDEIWFDDLEINDSIVETFREKAPSILSALQENRTYAKETGMEESCIDSLIRELSEQQKTIAEKESFSTAERRELWELLKESVLAERKIKRYAFCRKLWSSSKDGLGTVWVDSMEKVFIDDVPIPEESLRDGKLTLFPGEREAIQMVLIPDREMKDLTVETAPVLFRRSLPAETFRWKVVGYVKIDAPALNRYEAEPFPYSGWWPDPLLEKTTFSAERNTFQPVWIEVKVPRGTKPGTYCADIIISGKDIKHKERLEVEVLPGYLPEKWYMKKNMSFSTRLAETGYPKRVIYGDRWKEVADKYYNLLIDYRIGIGSLYESIDYNPPEVIKKAVDSGQNFLHAMGIASARHDSEGKPTLKTRDFTKLNHLETTLAPWLKEQEMMSISHFWGFDEQWHEYFEYAVEIFGRVKKTGIRTISTIHDNTYGTDSVLGEVIDVFVRPVSWYDYEMALKAREQGKEVWWYNGPGFNIESSSVFPRIIPWRTLLVEADGFLIWNMNNWTAQDFISDSIRSDWNPDLYGAGSQYQHSYPMLVYPGVDGPVSCMRLENFRDGVEDYDIFCETAERIRRPGESSIEARRRLMAKLGIDRNDSMLMSPEQVRGLRIRLAEYWKE
jgi:hypothetical protein